ncbi:beta-glucosidase [Cladophialophora psammophila CBS 110553]|uniref:Probable beta-glucosidase E n=1 Tax=Cladophialophora psammophila CBS 110553 TaxID=1182543 RepID=W9WZ98_9EURO|nr:beta-glucosidase [Cladophialophora psammophila CBS 110553]EXJ63574.1 beta-glucosidase [Cladophialophora psammophila CBS 110553]
MSSRQAHYQPLENATEVELDGGDRSDDDPKEPQTYTLRSGPPAGDAASASEVALLGFSAHDRSPRRRKYSDSVASRFCAGRRLTKQYITLSVLLLAVIVSVISGGGYWFYTQGQINGQSPPWYPTPQGGTLPSWQDSYDKARKLVDRMSLVEKVNITTGTGWAMGFCVGNTAPALSVGFPSLCLQDGPLGIRFADHATSFPAGITVGATWNRDLMRRRGAAHARQARLKGVNVILGPAMGPLGRNPAGGRDWEGFGSDPVLQGVAAYETIQGIQSQGVMATAKHYIGNEQEHFRRGLEWGLPEALSSNMDDRTLHEVYAWPFAESVRAGVASIMCSYQMVNNSYACANSKLMNGILKDELGFQGFVQSDWLAQRSGVASALAGLDMSMPGDGLYWQDGRSLFGKQLTVAVLNGSLPMTRLNDMVTRIVAAWYQLGQDSWSSEGPNFSSWTTDEYGYPHPGSSSKQDKILVNKYVETENDQSRQLAREVASEGIVLLKNEDSILPLSSALSELGPGTPKRVAVLGEDAGPGKGPNYCEDRACNQGTLAVGWGSGATDFTYLVDPLSALKSSFDKSVVEITSSLTNKVSSSLSKALREQHLCLVFGNADAGEGHRIWHSQRADRNDLEIQKGAGQLIRTVADACGGPVVVIIHSVGPVILEDFAGLESVKAIIFANLPGQESGNALADVLFGRTDASGRLPYTVGRSLVDYGPGAPVLYYPNAIIPQVDFKEGLFIDYRHFDKADIEPRYPFGHGLSFTTFNFSDLVITSLKSKSRLPSSRPLTLTPPRFDETIPPVESALIPSTFTKLRKFVYPYVSKADKIKKGRYPYPDGYEIVQEPSAAGGGEGGNPALFEEYVRVQVRVTNTGHRKGKSVVQLYVSFPGAIMEPSTNEIIETPVRVLRNFTKIELEAGSEQVVNLTLTRKDLSYWSTVQQNWVMPDGPFTLAMGRSSRDLPLQGTY